jgi:tetratricopeptide (TPR) repeat protein
VKEVPDNQEYKDALIKAKQEAAKARLVKAKQALVSAEQNLPALEKIARDVDVMVSMDPGSSEIKAVQKDLAVKINGLKATLKSLYQQSEIDMQKEDWSAAIAKLNQINKIFPNYEDTGNRLARIRQEGVKSLYQQANNLGKQEEWKMAAEAFKMAMDINPNYLDVSQRYRDAKLKDNLSYYMDEGARAEGAKNLERAIILYEKASDYPPVDPALTKKLETLKAKAGQLYFEESVKLVRQGRLYAAMKKLEAARNLVPSIQNDPLYKEHVTVTSDALMKRADKFTEKELWGNALVWMQKIEIVNPNYPELFQKTIDVKDSINKRIRKSIAVFDFSSPSAEKDVKLPPIS